MRIKSFLTFGLCLAMAGSALCAGKATSAANKNTAAVPTAKRMPKQPAATAAPTAQKSSSAPKTATAPAAKKQTKSIHFIVHEKRRYVSLSDVAKFYGMVLGEVNGDMVLFSQANRIEFQPKKRTGKINGIAVTYQFKPLIQDKKWFISEIDFLKMIDPAIRRKLTRHPLKRIMLDPGHGGNDKGAPGPVLPEKVITLQLALQTQKELQKYGFEVLLTRSADTTVTLQQRADLCEKYKPDLYISIHCNATTNKEVKGIETWLLAAFGGQSAQEQTVKTTDDKGNKFDKYNMRLAYEIQKAMLKSFPSSLDRGVKASRFFVLRNATAPAVLMEVGFLSNKEEGKSLTAKKTQNKIVEAILNG